jgi:hypothetical protein
MMPDFAALYPTCQLNRQGAKDDKGPFKRDIQPSCSSRLRGKFIWFVS